MVKTNEITKPLNWPLNWGPVYLTEEEFKELEDIHFGRAIVEPTESIKRAAKMIRQLHHHRI